MSDTVQALGDVAEGALLAQTVEPTAGGAGGDGHTHESACLNCGTVLVGPHCHGCGQPAHVHRTLGAFFHDLLHGVFHLEGKIWGTLPALVLHPGRLTREYIDGRRASHVSPIACFLLGVFLLFAAFHAFEPELDLPQRRPIDVAIAKQAEAIAKKHAARVKLEATIKAGAGAAALGEPGADTDAPAEIDEARRELVSDLAAAQARMDQLHKLKAAGLKEVGNELFDGDGSGAHSDLGWLDRAFAKGKANPALLIYKLQSNAYKFAWLLIPISVPFVWLLFPLSRRFKAYDHTVFVTYSLSFMLLLAAVATALHGLGVPKVDNAAFFVPPVHMVAQLRGTYGLGWRGALWRAALLCAFAVIALTLFALAMVALGTG